MENELSVLMRPQPFQHEVNENNSKKHRKQQLRSKTEESSTQGKGGKYHNDNGTFAEEGNENELGAMHQKRSQLRNSSGESRAARRE